MGMVVLISSIRLSSVRIHTIEQIDSRIVANCNSAARPDFFRIICKM